MHDCLKDNGKAENGNTPAVNYWCFLGDCMAVMNTSLFVLMVVWFCSVALCSLLCQLAEYSQRKETTQLTKHVSSVKRHFMFPLTALNSYFVPTAMGEIEQRKCGQTLGSASGKTNGNRYSSLYLILWKLNITPLGHCVHLSLQRAKMSCMPGFPEWRSFHCWPVAKVCKEIIG